MKELRDQTEEFIRTEFQKEADRIVQESSETDEGDEGIQYQNHIASIKDGLVEKTKNIDAEKLVAQLPDEYKELIELGRQVKKDKVQDADDSNEKKKSASRRKKRKAYIGTATAAVLFLTIGITSIGGAERVVRFMKSVVGEREVSQIDSNENNAVSVEEKEEEAYQTVKDELGIDPVKVTIRPKELIFSTINIDQKLQTVELIYYYKKEMVSYYITLSYTDSAWAFDVEDKISNRWTETVHNCPIEIVEYFIPDSKIKRYSAQFEYKKVEYTLNATMDKQEFLKIIKNLHFL